MSAPTKAEINVNAAILIAEAPPPIKIATAKISYFAVDSIHPNHIHKDPTFNLYKKFIR